MQMAAVKQTRPVLQRKLATTDKTIAVLKAKLDQARAQKAELKEQLKAMPARSSGNSNGHARTKSKPARRRMASVR